MPDSIATFSTRQALAASASAALEALDLGLRAIPIAPNVKRPPAGFRWRPFQDRAPGADEIEDWWRRWPGANVAVLTGTSGGVLVIDLDADGDGCLPDWPGDGRPLPDGLVVATPSGGRHFYCRHVPGVRCSAGRLAARVDVRGEGGYVLASPSVVAGRPYRVLRGSLAEAMETPCPAWLREALAASPRHAAGADDPADDPTPAMPDLPASVSGASRVFLRDGADEGTRNRSLFRAACELAAGGVPRGGSARLLALACQRCRPPLPWPEAARTVASARSRPRRPGGSAVLGALTIPATLAARDDLTWPAKAVLANLRRYDGPSGRVFPSQERQARDLGVGERSIRRALQVLERTGDVEITHKRGGANCYRLEPGWSLDVKMGNSPLSLRQRRGRYRRMV